MARLIQTLTLLLLAATVSAFSLAQPPSSSGIKTCAIGSTGVMNVENPVDVGGAIKFNDLAGASSPHWDGKNAYDRRPYDKQSVFCQNGSKTAARNLRGTCKLAMNTAGGTIKKMVCTG